MSRWQSRVGWGMLLVSIAAIGVTLSLGVAEQNRLNAARGGAPETLLPQEAVFYLGWDGSEKHQAAWEQTAAYEALYKSGLAPALSKAVRDLLARSGSADAALFGTLYEHVAANGLSLAAALVPQAGGRPQPLGVLVVHRGAKLEPELAAFVKRHTRRELQFREQTVRGRKVTSAALPQAPGLEFSEVGWWAEGEHLVVAVGAAAVNTTIEIATGQNGRGNITRNRLWSKYRGGDAGFAVTAVGWLDVKTFRDMLGELPLPGQTADGQPLTINRVLEPFGLDGLEAAVSRSGYKGKAVWSETHVETRGPRRGLLALVDQQPITLADLPPLPADSAGFFACSLDWAKLYDDLTALAKDVAGLGPPQARQQVAGVIDNLPQLLPFHPRNDLLAPLGNVVCVYGDSRQSLFGLGIGLALKVDDAERLRRTLDGIAGAIAEQAEPEQFRVRKTTKHGSEVVTLEFARGAFSPSYVIDKGWLNVGLFPQSVEAFLLRADGKLDRWQPSAEVEEALAELPKEFTSISITDPRPMVQTLMSLAPIMLPIAQQALREASRPGREIELPISLADLPPAEVVVRPLFPNVSVSTIDEAGFYGTSRTSLPAIPFAPAGGGGGSVATTSVLVALLLPAVQQSREAARRTQSRNNLKQIGLAMHNYHDVHQQLPPGTHPNEKLKPEQRLSWQASVLPYLDQQALHRQLDFDKAWDAEANQRTARVRIPTLINPGMAGGTSDTEYGPTHYVGIAGVGKDAPTLPVTDRRAGMFGYNRVTKFSDVHDGLSNTVAVSEANKDFGPWAAGGPSTIRGLTTRPYINGPDGIGGPWGGGRGGGGFMLLGDGAVRFISKDINPAVMEALTTIRGGEAVGDF